jgi:hypothetical protein
LSSFRLTFSAETSSVVSVSVSEVSVREDSSVELTSDEGLSFEEQLVRASRSAAKAAVKILFFISAVLSWS